MFIVRKPGERGDLSGSAAQVFATSFPGHVVVAAAAYPRSHTQREGWAGVVFTGSFKSLWLQGRTGL